MNIHEYQAKEILKKFGVNVPNGIAILSLEEIESKSKLLKSKKIVIKAQIHSGGRGKAGGVKIVDNIEELKTQAKNLYGKKLITHQTGPKGRIVKKLYLEEVNEIQKEFYLSCLVDRDSSKIAFISSAEGGVDIEEVARKKPEKIITTKLNLSSVLDKQEIAKIIQPFNLPKESSEQAIDLVKSMHTILVKLDASLIEINPLILTKEKNIICLDASIRASSIYLFRSVFSSCIVNLWTRI